jgi:hypothetical protein
MFGTWSEPGWWQDPLSVLPNLIGFTLGGYAILFAIGDDDFKSLIAGAAKEKEVSPFMGVSSAFVHFLLLQISALTIALLAKSHPIGQMLSPRTIFLIGESLWPDAMSHARALFWFFGYLIFIYAILAGLAAVFSVFRMARMYDRSKNTD